MKMKAIVLAACAVGSLTVFGKLTPDEEKAYNTRGVDEGPTVRIDLPGGFDVGLTAEKSTNKVAVGRGRTEKSCVYIVPPCEYVSARVRFSVDPDPKKDRALTLRLTRYVDNRGASYVGRSFHGTCNTLVETDRVSKRFVGTVTSGGHVRQVYEADVPIDMGDLIGILHKERRGTFLNNGFSESEYRVTNIGNYLDFEVLGRLVAERSPAGDCRLIPDEKKRSAIRVHSVTLEKAPAELRVDQVQPGNVFHNDEKPETKVAVDVKRPGDYTLVWTVRNPENETVSVTKRRISADASFTVDLAQREPGWYALDYELFAGERRLMTHHAAFVLLGKDTRTAGIGEGPYGTWTYGGGHYCSPDLEFVGPLMLKAGFRRGQGLIWKPEDYHRYKLSPQTVRWPGPKATNEEQRVAAIREQLDTDPNTRSFLMFHEEATWPYQQAPELTGSKYGPKFAWVRAGQRPKRDVEKDKVDARKRHEDAMMKCGFLRKHFPEIYISLGNSLAATELVAETIRNGFPEEYADYMGLETVVRTSKPERQWEGTIQAADLMMQTAEAFGYRKWKVNSAFESCYRIEDAIGSADLTAAWYVRDLLISQCWRFPDIFIGVLTDTGNSYTGSFWGESGLCRGIPYAYPRKAYAGIAVATKMLDMVTDARRVDCGDECVYVVDYTRRDGKHVWAMWTSRGTAEIAFDLAKKVEMTDMYGRVFKPERDGGNILARVFRPRKPVVKAGPAVKYFLGDVNAVRSARVGRRTYPDEPQPADAKLVQATDSVAGWKVDGTKIEGVEREAGPFLPFRTVGKYEIREVVDEERGKCLELELAQPNSLLPKTMSEYCVVELEKPIPLEGDPASLGAWVKGNSGWGSFCWVVESANGRRSYSFGCSADADVYDYDGAFSLDYTGWAFLKIGIARESSVHNMSFGGVFGFNWVGAGTPSAGPHKLVGFGLAAQNRPLFLTERRPYPQKIRIGGIYGFDYK